MLMPIPFQFRRFLFTSLTFLGIMLVGHENAQPLKRRLRRTLLVKAGKPVSAQPAGRFIFSRPGELTFYVQRPVLLSGK
ncbi:hypothetical protein LX87_01841 [Larkinella arboricola]|uniref:Uncharacterized protein n=1 Tax=Larkinella arboricola TaxID=643671 RepID=A0A327X4Y7_LARAB|nr:hypothetical protein LX87_01841 [Larkinella arboricola]